VAPWRRPDFLGIGAHKAGTSWLHAQLARHPGIWVPPRKELHFFDRSRSIPSPSGLAEANPLRRALDPAGRRLMLEGSRSAMRSWARGRFDEAAWWRRFSFGSVSVDWYASLFAHLPAEWVCGEITPAYSVLATPQIEEIASVNPDMKLVFMLRDPVERAWSALRYDAERPGMKIDLESESEVRAALQGRGMALRGDYERTLALVGQRFPASQILLGFHDAIEQDPTGLMTGITDFLGVDPFEPGILDTRERVNASAAQPRTPAVDALIRTTYAPMIERLARRFGSHAAAWAAGANPAPSSGPRPATLHP